MKTPRDRQRQRVYDWETTQRRPPAPIPLMPMTAIQALAARIWLAERARYGHGRTPPPIVRAGRSTQNRAFAYWEHHAISVPFWSRRPWTVCHEIAHLLCPYEEPHGPRFVGVLIGLLARHHGRDAAALLASARAAGLRVSAQSIGAVPTTAPPAAPPPIAEQLLALAPISDMDAACELGLHWRQVRGHALHLVRAGRARWFRGRLHAIRTLPAGGAPAPTTSPDNPSTP